jgi:hypothetical protein
VRSDTETYDGVEMMIDTLSVLRWFWIRNENHPFPPDVRHAAERVESFIKEVANKP